MIIVNQSQINLKTNPYLFKMRIKFDVLKEIQNQLGDFEVGSSFEADTITLRFGYWRQIDLILLNDIVPSHIQPIENEVDDDEDTGVLFNYILRRRTS